MRNPFKFFRRDDQQPAQAAGNQNAGQTIGDPGTISDVLLRALISGTPITREQALTIPAVAADVDFIAGAVACMPAKLYKRKNGEIEEVTDDPRVNMLNCDTGDTLDGFQLKKAMVTDYFLGKGGYCYIERRGNTVTGLYYVRDIDVSTVIDYENPIYKNYKIICGAYEYKPFEFIKLLRNTQNGAEGVGVIEELQKALEAAYRTLLYQIQLVKTGGNKRGFLKSERRLGDNEITALKEGWRRMYGAGAGNEETEQTVIVLNDGVDFKEASSTSVEMQLNENKKTFSDEIHGIFHVTDDFELTFKNAIYPIVKAFETALNRDLLLEKEKGKYFFELDVKEIIKASIKDRYDSYKIAKECGFMTTNEMRQRENMNKIAGGDVINVGLSAVLYDVKTHKYYTPNTGTAETLQETEEAAIINHDENIIN